MWVSATRVRAVAVCVVVAACVHAASAVAQAPSREAAASADSSRQAPVRVGWCSSKLGPAAAPYAVALRKGWFQQAGSTIDLVPLGGPSACIKAVLAGDVLFALPSVEATAVARAQGAAVKYFYTAYQSNVYGMAVPVDSPIRSVADLKGRRVGVVSLTSASAVISRLLVRTARLDPDQDVTLIAAGDAVQTTALLRVGAVDALSQFDMQYALIERSGIKLRRLKHPEIDHFPSNGFMALEQTLKTHGPQAVALARGYAMGTVSTLANPREAVEAMWAQWPQTRVPGQNTEEGLLDGVAMLMAREPAWRLGDVGASRWGQHIEKNYQAHLDWLHEHGFVSVKLAARDLLNSDLLAEINAFDAAAVLTDALRTKP